MRLDELLPAAEQSQKLTYSLLEVLLLVIRTLYEGNFCRHDLLSTCLETAGLSILFVVIIVERRGSLHLGGYSYNIFCRVY